MKKSILIIGIAAILGACSEKQTVAAARNTAVTNTSPALQPVASQMGEQLTGRVLETMNAAGYTYVRVETPAGDRWAAVRETKVKTGSTITINGEMVARDFESKSLGRKFDAVVFGAIAGAAPASPPVAAPMTSAMGTPSQHMNVAVPVQDVKVEKAEGGHRIAEVWAAKTELKDKTVVVRGKVVKFLPEIMGKNWIHLRDGSGQREQGTDDLTITTNDVARVGDVVTVSGTLSVDKDFGSGYRYGVIIENAKLRK